MLKKSKSRIDENLSLPVNKIIKSVEFDKNIFRYYNALMNTGKQTATAAMVIPK